MRAVVLTGTRDDRCVRTGDVEEPKDGVGRLVIEVAYAGVTRMEPRWDTSWTNADGTERTQPIPLGLEFAGRVRSLGPGVTGFSVGQRVAGMTDPHRGGAMAEFVSSEAEYVLSIPDGLAFEQASTLPLSGQTAWQAIVRHGALKSGQRVLIHGGAGAVGTFAVQIARWIDAHVTVTAAAQDGELCRSLGADEVIDYRHERFEDRPGLYDLVFDQIGGEVRDRSWALLKRGGRLVTIAGEQADAPDQERAHALGVSAVFFVVERNVGDLRRLAELVVARRLRPVIGKVFELAFATKAFDKGCGRFVGKAVMICRATATT